MPVLSRLLLGCAALLAAPPAGLAPLALVRGEDAEDEDAPADDLDVEEEDLSAEQLRHLHGKMDLDANGALSLNEAMEYAQRVGREIASKDVGAILEEIDLNKDGKLTLEEHIADIESQAEGGDEEEMKELAVRKEVERAKFGAADDNNDGLLEVHELTSLFYPETHDGVLRVTVGESMRGKDKNGDGQLSIHEFWEADPGDGEQGDITEEERADFNKLDTDGNGVLSLDEVRAWESGHFHTAESMQKLFEVSDKNNDMHVSAQELMDNREAIALSDAQYHLIEWAEHHEL